MPSPWKHPDTGMYYLRVRVPADLVVTIGKVFHKQTLGTKDPATAKAFFIERHAALLKHWDTLRAGPQPLSHKQRNALSGTRYKDNVAILGDNPESVTIWERVIHRCNLADETPETLEATFGAITDRMLEREGLLIDASSRYLLLQDVCRADRQAAEYLLRNAQGDYSPDPIANRFADWESIKPTVEVVKAEPVAATTLTHLFDLWKEEHLANKKSLKTVGEYKHKVDNLIEFMGHQDAEAITPKNIADWIRHLRIVKGLAAKTVGHKYKSAISAI